MVPFFVRCRRRMLALRGAGVVAVTDELVLVLRSVERHESEHDTGRHGRHIGERSLPAALGHERHDGTDRRLPPGCPQDEPPVVPGVDDREQRRVARTEAARTHEGQQERAADHDSEQVEHQRGPAADSAHQEVGQAPALREPAAPGSRAEPGRMTWTHSQVMRLRSSAKRMMASPESQ